MSEKLRSVNTKFWDDSFITELNPSEKLLFLYLLTNSLANILGIYEITIKRISYDTGLTKETIAKGLESFAKGRKAFHTEDNYIIMPNWLKNQRLNTNMKVAVAKEFNALPKHIKDSILSNGSEALPNNSEGFRMVMECLDKYEIEIEDEIEDENKGVKKFNFDFIEESYKDIFESWLNYKKERKESYKTQTSLEACYKNLKKLSGNNPETAKEIIENSFANNWSGLFALKNNKTFTPAPIVPEFSSGPDR
jgi:hypothetical protein